MKDLQSQLPDLDKALPEQELLFNAKMGNITTLSMIVAVKGTEFRRSIPLTIQVDGLGSRSMTVSLSAEDFAYFNSVHGKKTIPCHLYIKPTEFVAKELDGQTPDIFSPIEIWVNCTSVRRIESGRSFTLEYKLDGNTRVELLEKLSKAVAKEQGIIDAIAKSA